MDAISPQGFLTLYLRLTASLLLGIVAINGIVDPLWVYHAPWLPQRFVKDQRQANPGLARFSTYDSVVVGNSLTENLLVSEIQANFGWQPIKLCISGSTAREQHLILEQALATGQVRDVVWAVDYFAFDFEPDVVRTADFPFHLYDRGLLTPLKYLVSASTLVNSIQVMLGAGVKDRESRFVWHDKMKYGTESVMAGWQKIIAKPLHQGTNEDVALRSAQKHLFEVIQGHPDIRFHVFIPPYSALYGVSEMVATGALPQKGGRPLATVRRLEHQTQQEEVRPRFEAKLATGDHFSARMRFKRQLAHTLLNFPNVELFDFEAAEEVTHDLDQYTDLVHFNLATSSAILRWMAEGRYRVQFESIDDQFREVEEHTYEYAKHVFSPENPLCGQLRIGELGLMLPTTIVSAASGKKPALRQIAEGVLPSRN